MSISERLEQVRQRIERAAARVDRDPAEVTLVAVSKRKPASAIREAYSAGCRDFGESYLQELQSKRQQLEDLTDLRWHFIGGLQSNKAQLASELAQLVHSVDRPKLLKPIARAGSEVLLQVQLQLQLGEARAGCDPDALAALRSGCEALGIRVRGLMTLPPPDPDPEAARPYFKQLAQLRDALDPSWGLSMGMSHDFEVAIEEGASWVRVGSSIFGARDEDS